ncbi:MAG TPA: helix-turn-helix domain-containing protein [Solirubrobacterales bacterium]|nr:helix-turn-helix domain-containing protein [Solirubrobacterales bacterium]
MATDGGDTGPIAVGSVLKQTRERRGIDLDTVERETKIRSKYLRAIEDEDWDALPGPAYARGFIRAYAELLGLDSEVLVDEYRHRHEQPPTESYELPEPVLRGRIGDDRPTPRARYAVIGALVAAAAVVLLVLGVTAGSDNGDGDGREARERKGDRRADAKRGSGSKPGGAGGDVTVKLVARSDVQACLIDNRDRVLIPDQVLSTGEDDGPYVAKRFRLELDPGDARVVVDGEPAAVPRSSEPTAYRLSPGGIRATEFTGGLCE